MTPDDEDLIQGRGRYAPSPFPGLMTRVQAIEDAAARFEAAPSRQARRRAAIDKARAERAARNDRKAR